MIREHNVLSEGQENGTIIRQKYLGEIGPLTLVCFFFLSSVTTYCYIIIMYIFMFLHVCIQENIAEDKSL